MPGLKTQSLSVDMKITPSQNGKVAAAPGHVRISYLEIFLVFLRLGLTSFGGPIAHLGYFRQEFVERRKWLSEQIFCRSGSALQFLAGSNQQPSLLFNRDDPRGHFRGPLRLGSLHAPIRHYYVVGCLWHPLG